MGIKVTSELTWPVLLGVDDLIDSLDENEDKGKDEDVIEEVESDVSFVRLRFGFGWLNRK